MTLLGIPALIVLVVAVGAGLAVAVGGQTLVYRRFPVADRLQQNDVAGFIITVVGTLYAVVLGFVTVIVWQSYDATRERVSVETAAVADAWHTAVGFPPSVRSAVRRDMLVYAKLMIDEEWPLMRQGRFSPRGDAVVMDATGQVGSFVPATPNAATAQQLELRLLNDLHDARLRRLAENETPLSWFAWLILGFGAVVVITLCFFFGVENTRAHVMMTSAVAMIVAAMFVLIFEMQFPFRSDLRIRPDAWVGLVDHIRYMDRYSPMNMRM